MISNASPIIFLANINQLNLLKKLFGKVTITELVKEEVLIENKPGYAILDKAIQEKWIVIENPKRIKINEIKKGEDLVIALAKEKKDNVIIDDANAIKKAISLNIPFIRTTTIIIGASNRNIISKKEASKLIDKLIEAGYYISPQIYLKIIEALK